MATLAAVRDAIADRIVTRIDSLDIPERQLTAYPRVVGRPNLPALVVWPGTWTPEAMGRGLVTYTFRIIVLVSFTDYDLAQASLDDYLEPSGPVSFCDIILSDPTLGLEGTNANHPELVAYGGQWPAAGVDHLGAEMTMKVHTRGDSGASS